MIPRRPLLSLTLAALGSLAGCNAIDDALSTYQHEGGTLTGNNTWSKGTHELAGSIDVVSGTLTVEACSTIKMPVGGKITVHGGGALVLAGTADCPVTVTSSKASPARGDWSYLEFYSTSSAANSLTYAVLEYGGTSGYGALWVEDGTTIAVTNTTVKQSLGVGAFLESGVVLKAFSGNTLTQNELGPVLVGPNEAGALGDGTYGPNDVQGIKVASGTVSKTATWAAHGVPYVLAGSIDVAAPGGALLTIAAGNTVGMPAGGKITVHNGGGLALEGTAAAPVTVTSAKATKAAGDWSYLEFYATASASDNRLRNAIVEYGGTTGYGAVWVETGASVEISNSTIRQSKTLGIDAEDGATLRNFTGNTVTTNGASGIALSANQVDQLGAGTYSPNGVDAIYVRGGTVDHTGTWAELGAPYLTESFAVQTTGLAADLTLAAGVEVLMQPMAKITVTTKGSLHLAGTAVKHVTITSAKNSPAAGDWRYIELYSDATGAKNVFEYADISAGGTSGYGQVWLDNGAQLSLSSCTFSLAPVCDVTKPADATLTVVAGASPSLCP